MLNYQPSSQVKIFTETGVGAQHHTSRFKAIDYVKKGDGGSKKKWQAIYSRKGWQMLYLIKIPLQILQKTGIILFFILSSKGPLFHPKNQAFLSRILFMLVSKLVTSFTTKDVFTKVFTKGIGGQIREDWSSNDETTTLDIIRIADFINKVVATRRLK